MEALSIGVVGLVLGLALGAVNLYYVLEMSQRDITGVLLAVPVPVQHRGDARAADAGGGVRVGALAGRVRGARVAGAGARVRIGGRHAGT